MNVRETYTKILKDSADRAAAARKTVMEVLHDSGYTASGKKIRVATVTDDLQVYLNEQRQAVSAAANHVVQDVEALFEIEQRQRDGDTGYQQRLASLLTLIPAVAEYGSTAALMQRISPFAEDPVACSAIEGVLRKTASELGDRSKVMAILSCIPAADGVQKRKEQLRKLEVTMLRHLDNFAIRVADPAYNSTNEETIHRSVEGGSSITTATNDYLAACSGDCTRYDAEKMRAGKEEQPITFDFNHVNE